MGNDKYVYCGGFMTGVVILLLLSSGGFQSWFGGLGVSELQGDYEVDYAFLIDDGTERVLKIEVYLGDLMIYQRASVGSGDIGGWLTGAGYWGNPAPRHGFNETDVITFKFMDMTNKVLYNHAFNITEGQWNYNKDGLNMQIEAHYNPE